VSSDRVNLLGLPRAQLETFVATRLGAKPFRARQLMKWIYRRGAADFSTMSDLAQEFRAQLGEIAEITVPQIVTEQVSKDGTRKWMLRMDEVQGIETVYIPEPDRGTLCISSQVGCAMDCTFCATAQQGFNRNLSAAEIVGQVWLAQRELAESSGDDVGRGSRGEFHGPVECFGTRKVRMEFRVALPSDAGGRQRNRSSGHGIDRDQARRRKRGPALSHPIMRGVAG